MARPDPMVDIDYSIPETWYLIPRTWRRFRVGTASRRAAVLGLAIGAKDWIKLTRAAKGNTKSDHGQ